MKITSDVACRHARTDKDQQDFPVEGVPGLALRVTREGRKVWTLRYRTGHGQYRRMKLGAYSDAMKLKDARDRAREELVAVARGKDPANAKREARDDATFGDLFNFWHEDHAEPKLARPHDELQRYKLHLEKPLGKAVVKNLTRHAVKAVLKAITKQAGPVQANRSVELVIRVLNHAVDEELIAINPVPRLAKNVEKSRARVLSDEELATLWQELERMEAWKPEPGKGARGKPLTRQLIRAIRILILTGQRRGEVAGIETSELRLRDAQPVWELPSTKTKNGEPSSIFLTPMAVFELRRAIAEAGSSRFVFPGEDGHIKPASISVAFENLCRRVGIVGACAHDVRRTVATGMARLKVPPHVLALVLNHVKKASDVTMSVYNRFSYDREKQDAMAAWENHLRNALGLTGDNVETIA